MNQRNKIATVYGLWFADLVGIVISFVLATYIRFRNFRDMEDKGIHFQVCLLLLLVCTIYSFFLDWNRNFVKRKTIKEFAAIVQYEIIMFRAADHVFFKVVGQVFTLGDDYLPCREYRGHIVDSFSD